jgi:hypothetical protein
MRVVDSEVIVCPHCGDQVTAVDATAGGRSGYADTRLGEAIRYLISGERALINHRCGDPNLRWLVPDPDANWWACEQPEREIDDDTLFDKFCSGCENRWVNGGYQFWHPDDLSESEMVALQKFLTCHDFKKPSYAYVRMFVRPRKELAEDMFESGERDIANGDNQRAKVAFEIAAVLGDDEITRQATTRLAALSDQ